MKKVFRKFILLSLVFLMIPLFNVSAYNPRELSDYAKEIDEAEEWTLDGQVDLTRQKIATVYNGVLSNPRLYNNHTVQWLTVGSGSSVKPVVWSMGSKDEWKASTLDKMIADYESKHPGYIVVGAVNGDFFDNSAGGTGEPTNFHVQEGEVMRAHWSGEIYRGVLGFGKTNKDWVDAVGPTHEANLSLKLLENNETIKTITVESTNDVPKETGVSVYTKALETNVDLTGYTVYEGEYKTYREASRKWERSYYLKGSIVDEVSITSLSSVPSGKFYIATKSETLNAGQELKIEYNLTGELAGIENAVGYNYHVLKNGVPQYQNATTQNTSNALHINTTHPRTLIGFKKDGSMVMMVVDGRGTPDQCLEGASLFQCGELLRLAGCVEGYNLDGGGSSTLMARIDGKMTLINNPSDARQHGDPWGTLRSTGNAVLLVMKDPKIQIEQAVGNSITIRKTGEVADATLQNVVVKVGTKEYPMTEDVLTVSGLKANIEYPISYTYEFLNEDGTIEKHKSSTYNIKTENYELPEIKTFEEDKLDKGSVTFKYRVNDENDMISKLYILNGENQIDLQELSGRVTIENIDTKIKNTFILIVELKNGESIELSSIEYEANTIPELEETPSGDDPSQGDDFNQGDNTSGNESSGCKKESMLLVVSFISLSTMFVIFKKKR